MCYHTCVFQCESRLRIRPESFALAGALSPKLLYQIPPTLLSWLRPCPLVAISNNYPDCVNRVSGAGEAQVSDSE